MCGRPWGYTPYRHTRDRVVTTTQSKFRRIEQPPRSAARHPTTELATAFLSSTLAEITVLRFQTRTPTHQLLSRNVCDCWQWTGNQSCPWVHFVWPNPTQPTTSRKIWTQSNPTQPNTTNNGAYSLVVTRFMSYLSYLSCVYCQRSMFFTVITRLKTVSLCHSKTSCSKKY